MQPPCGETLPSGRAVALVAWCEANDFDAGDVQAPHVKAFLGGYDAGFDDGWEDGNEHATEYLAERRDVPVSIWAWWHLRHWKYRDLCRCAKCDRMRSSVGCAG